MAPLPQRRLKQPASIALLAFTVLLAVSGSAAAQPGPDDVLLARSVGSETVEIELPELEVKKGDRPLDDQIRVSLYLPTQLELDVRAYCVEVWDSKWKELFNREMSLREEQFLHLSEARVKIARDWSVPATLVTVHLAQPLSGRIAEIVRSLFPHTTVLFGSDIARKTPLLQNGVERTGSPLCAAEAGEQVSVWEGGTPITPEDLRINVEMIPHLIEREKQILVGRTLNPTGREKQIHVLERLDVQVKLTISDRAQRTVDVIHVVGMAEVDGFTISPSTDQWEDIGEEALLQVSDKLVEGLRRSQKLGACLKTLAEPRALPAGLVIAAKIDDADSLFPNGRLDAGDEARLLVQVENKGPGPAYRVGVQASSDRPEITVSGEGVIGDLEPGAKKDVVLRVAGGLGLSTGVAKLRVEAVERRGYGSRPVEVEVATSQVLPPKLEIVDITLNDRGGRPTGDGDGQPGNGEAIEAVVRVRNAGQRRTWGWSGCGGHDGVSEGGG